MIRITVDTNILISATFWHGSSEKIIDKVENKEITLVLSEPILEEYYKVLNYDEIKEKIKNKGLEMKQSVLRISTISEIIDIKSKIDLIKDDPSDNKFIECAIDGKADYIISKDNHLLRFKEYKGIKIITPEEFLEIV